MQKLSTESFLAHGYLGRGRQQIKKQFQCTLIQRVLTHPRKTSDRETFQWTWKPLVAATRLMLLTLEQKQTNKRPVNISFNVSNMEFALVCLEFLD